MTDLIDALDQQDDLDSDAELMQALGAEVRAYFDEQIAILLARLDARLDSQQEILVAIRNLQTAMTAPRMIVSDENGKAIGVRILS